MTRDEILSISEQVNSLKKDANCELPDNSYFLDEAKILCYRRKYGDTRYPYQNDGLVLFAHADGRVDCVEGMFNIFKKQDYSEDSPICFFAGEKYKDGFFPYSVTGADCQLFESEDTVRYTVYTPACVYYFTETDKAVFAARIYVDSRKHLRFSVGAVNKAEKREIYLSSFFEPILRYEDHEGFYFRMTKFSEHYDNGNYLMYTRNKVLDCMAVKVSYTGEVLEKHSTTAKKTVLGHKGGNLTNAYAFKNGFFDAQIPATNTTDLACVSDIYHFSFEESGFVGIDYDIFVTDDKNKAEEFLAAPKLYENEEEQLKLALESEISTLNRMKISFEDWHNEKINANVLNKFLTCVRKQVSFCALGKNYAEPFLGIRDVFQQLENALMWQPEDSRRQIVKVMDYMLDSGRAPRQISFVTKEKPIPEMDLRPFIDQGFWIIGAIHNYLAFTDDKSLLDEICGYYTAEKTFGPLSRSSERDSILCHLIKISEFLVSNVDETTHCIHTLFGDWNDALDALGKTKDKNKEYGDGVSVMATQQLYLALGQMCDILKYAGQHSELIKKYEALREIVADGVRTYAIAEKDGKKRVIHGWGENRSYFVGSYNDYDGKDRKSLTSNSFFAISGLYRKFPEMCDDICENIISMDSKYGLLTFDKPFSEYSEKIGRLSTITPGTYENNCAYVHASTFGVMALFLMGRPKEAWNFLEKAMVITNKNATRTTFVMPNSYCYTEKYSADGDSMGDWYTGSGTVLIKDIIKCGFGINPTMDGLVLCPASYMPSEKASVDFTLKGKNIRVSYENNNSGNREIFLNDRKLDLLYDSISKNYRTFLKNEEFKDGDVLLITD